MNKAKKTAATGIIVIACVLMFGLGAYASANWKSYDGNVAQSEDHVDEIMEILREVNADKLTAEEALTALEALNPAGLAKLNKELRERITALERELANKAGELADKQREIDEKNREINDKNKVIEGKDAKIRELTQINEELSAYVKHLEAEITKANEAVDGMNGKTRNAVEEARGIAK